MGGGMTEPEEYIASLKETIQELMLEVATLEEKLRMSEKALEMCMKVKETYKDMLHDCEGIEDK